MTPVLQPILRPVLRPAFGMAVTRSGGGGGTPSVLSAINATGWSAEYIGTPPTLTPDVSPVAVSVSRQGYDATGAATTHVDSLVITKRVRQPYPNQASLTANTVSLSDYVYSTDTIAGVTNNSAENSPAPVVNWAQCDRQLVGDLLEAEVVGGHRDARNGKPLACVIFTATDGTLSVSQTVALPVISPRTGDKHPVVVYRCSLDISTLATGQITLNAKAFGWVGGSTATVDSATNGTTQGTRDFCPQIYTKNVALLAARPRIYIQTTGTDATAYVGTDDALAQASPALTLKGGIERARTVLGTGACDGLLIRLGAGTWELSATVSSGNLNTNHEVIIERDPLVSKASAIYGFGTGNYVTRAAYLRIRDCTIVRSNTFAINVNAGGKVILRDVDINNGSYNAAMGSNGVYLEGGVTITNGAASPLGAGTPELRLCRGVTYGVNTTNYNVEGWNVIGCELRGSSFPRGARSQSGMIIAFNRITGVAVESFIIGNNNDVVGALIAQNVVEFIGTASTSVFSPSRDSATGDIAHLMAWNNTFAGAFLAGRGNILYDDAPNGNLRTHKLQRFVGNIHVQINVKNDWFAGINGTADAASKTGDWGYVNGAGCQGEFSQYIDAGSGADDFRQDYAGLGAKIGASVSVRNDPLFTNYQGTTYNGTTYTAGAGNGTYTLQSGSPADNIVSNAVLPFDLAGNARPTTADAAGAYAL